MILRTQCTSPTSQYLKYKNKKDPIRDLGDNVMSHSIVKSSEVANIIFNIIWIFFFGSG